MVSVYSATTGRCLFRETPDVDTAEQQRVQTFVRRKILLRVAPEQQTVEGVISVKRNTQEPFVFVVETAFDHPIRSFYETVRTICSEEEAWDLQVDRDDVPIIEPKVDVTEQVSRSSISELQECLQREERTSSVYSNSRQAILTLIEALDRLAAEELAADAIVVTRNRNMTFEEPTNHLLVVGENATKPTDKTESATDGIVSELLARFR